MLPRSCPTEAQPVADHRVRARLSHQVHATCIASALGTIPNFSRRCDPLVCGPWLGCVSGSHRAPSVSQVDRQLALLEEVIEPSELSARWGKARSKVGVVVALGSASKASAP